MDEATKLLRRWLAFNRHVPGDTRESLMAATAAHLEALPAAAPRQEQHCQTNHGDVCYMARFDRVVCPDDSCDIDDGTRKPPAAAQPAPLPGPPREPTVEWLIERGQQEGESLTYWYRAEPYPAQGQWVTDANKATRFASFSAAEKCVQEKHLVFCRTTEHLWLPARQAQGEGDCVIAPNPIDADYEAISRVIGAEREAARARSYGACQTGMLLSCNRIEWKLAEYFAARGNRAKSAVKDSP